MPIRDIGILSPGDMGQAIALRLREAGFAVHTALEGRSERTRALAREAGLNDCGSLAALVVRCDLVLSVLNPAAALETARAAAAAMQAGGRAVLFADLNAVSPGTAREMDRLVREAGGAFVDGGIIGPPPRGAQARPRLYLSGPEAYRLAEIRHPNLLIRVLSERVGDASAVKMCYAAMTKGTTALAVELLVAARRLGVERALEQELRDSRADIYEWQQKNIALMPPKAHRWVPEMHEIARTFAELGMTPRMLEGAAEIYDMVAAAPLGKESPEQARRAGRSAAEVLEALARGER